jgi:hypothetical protein
VRNLRGVKYDGDHVAGDVAFERDIKGAVVALCTSEIQISFRVPVIGKRHLGATFVLLFGTNPNTK